MDAESCKEMSSHGDLLPTKDCAALQAGQLLPQDGNSEPAKLHYFAKSSYSCQILHIIVVVKICHMPSSTTMLVLHWMAHNVVKESLTSEE